MICDDLNSDCAEFIEELTEGSQENVAMSLGHVRSELVASEESFSTGLKLYRDSGLFNRLHTLFTRVLDDETEIKIIKLWDFFLQSSCKENLGILFENGITNEFIQYPFNFKNSDILRTYMSVLKALAMRGEDVIINYLFTNDFTCCPIYMTAVHFISFADSTVISATRSIVLAINMIKNEQVQKFVFEQTDKSIFYQLVDSDDNDRFAFLQDLMCIASDDIVQMIIGVMREKLFENANNLEFIGSALPFLVSTPVRPILIELMSSNIWDYSLEDPLTLAIMLFCLKNQLINFDSSIQYGFLPSPCLPHCQPEDSKFILARNILDELEDVFMKGESVAHTALILNILENIKSEPPEFVTEAQSQIISLILESKSSEYMELILFPEKYRQRTDIEYYLKAPVDERTENHVLLLQLAEIQASICRWYQKVFKWFEITDIEGENEEKMFTLKEGNLVTLNKNTISVGSRWCYKIWQTIPLKIGHTENLIILNVYNEPLFKSSFIQSVKEQIKLSFQTAVIRKGFKQALHKFHHYHLQNIMNKLCF